MGTTFYFYAVTIFTPDDNVLAFFTEEVVYSMLIFEWVTVAQSQMNFFFCKDVLRTTYIRWDDNEVCFVLEQHA